MSLARSSARSPRRRRRFAPTPVVESLETRQLLAASALGGTFGSPYDLHAQHLRLVQLHRLMAAPPHPAAASTARQPVVAAAVVAHHRAARAATGPAATEHRFNDYVILGRGGGDSDADGDGDDTGGDRDGGYVGNGGTTATGDVDPATGGTQATYAPVVGAYTPAQVRAAYGFSSLALANQGQGVTIAIVDEFDDPDITNDANVFSAQYNLPQFNAGGPTLTVTKDQALGTVTSGVGTGVGGETSLDVEWAHAMAPQANIDLVEVPATGTVANEFAQLLHGVQVGAQLGAVAVSLSYGFAESSIGAANVVGQDATYLAPGTAASGTVVSVSSGDGSSPLFPATSPNVVAVGGSSVYLASVKGKYSFETAWGGLTGNGAGGGGLSTNFASPTYQSSNGVTYAKRAIPDVAMIADPVTGVSYYDTLDVTSTYPDPWGQVGGTSLASPVFAGMIALAQQDRLAGGLPMLTSAQVDNDIYTLYNSPSYATYFHDINQGSNANNTGRTRTTVAGYTTTTGYDLATGVGSPIASTFVPYLSSTSA